MAVVETVERTVRTIGGEVLPVTITKRVGLCEYVGVAGDRFWADEATFMDFGPKLGTQRTYIMHPAVPPTEEEKAAVKARLLEVAAQAMTEQGLWGKIGRLA